MPVATTVLVVPPELNVNPFEGFATKVQPLKEPVDTAHVPPLLVMVIEVEVSVSWKDTETSFEANPLPEAVTVTPLGPYLGLNVRLVTVPVNDVVAVSDDAFPVAVTVLETPAELNVIPFVEFTMNVHPLNAPDVTAQVPPPLVIGMVLPARVKVTNVSVDEKPDPPAVTVTSAGPLEGVRVSAVTVPVNVAVAESPA